MHTSLSIHQGQDDDAWFNDEDIPGKKVYLRRRKRADKYNDNDGKYRFNSYNARDKTEDDRKAKELLKSIKEGAHTNTTRNAENYEDGAFDPNAHKYTHVRAGRREALMPAGREGANVAGLML